MKKHTLLIKFVTILMILSALSCGLFSKNDPDFAGDIIDGPEKFQYDPNKLPVIGKTTEQELLEIYPKPWLRKTFKKPITKEILGRKFEIEKNYRLCKLLNGPSTKWWLCRYGLSLYSYIL